MNNDYASPLEANIHGLESPINVWNKDYHDVIGYFHAAIMWNSDVEITADLSFLMHIIVIKKGAE